MWLLARQRDPLFFLYFCKGNGSPDWLKEKEPRFVEKSKSAGGPIILLLYFFHSYEKSIKCKSDYIYKLFFWLYNKCKITYYKLKRQHLKHHNFLCCHFSFLFLAISWWSLITSLKILWGQFTHIYVNLIFNKSLVRETTDTV